MPNVVVVVNEKPLGAISWKGMKDDFLNTRNPEFISGIGCPVTQLASFPIAHLAGLRSNGILTFFPDKVLDDHAGRGILYSVPPEEQDYDEYLTFNRGKPAIKLNPKHYGDVK